MRTRRWANNINNIWKHSVFTGSWRINGPSTGPGDPFHTNLPPLIVIPAFDTAGIRDFACASTVQQQRASLGVLRRQGQNSARARRRPHLQRLSVARAHGMPGGLDDRLPAEHPRGPPLEPQEEPGTGRSCLIDEVCLSLELEMADELVDVIFQSISSQPSENGVDMYHVCSCVGSVLYGSLNILLLCGTHKRVYRYV